MLRKPLALFLCGLLLFSAAGCSAASGQTASSSSATIESNEASSAATNGDETAPDTATTSYADTIFDTSYVHEINVEISEEDWADLLENPTEKTKYSTTVTIDGTTLTEVSFATKGNTSLTQVASTDSDRYSFKLNFDKFVDGQSYDGLDKLNLNNAYSDSTYLKDYMSYRIMAEAGVDAPLVSFVSLSINGELYGLYVAVEDVSDSFLKRNYGEDAGELYKPETAQLENAGGGGGGGQRGRENAAMPEGAGGAQAQGETENESRTPPDRTDGGPPAMGERPEGGGFGGGMGGMASGADLAYTDDEIASYSDIFDNAETDATEEDMQRVIAALRQLSTGENLESAVDVDAALQYFVAHNFVLNFDSYTGNMLHNYYLYEEDGLLTMLPWDYNLAFGGFGGASDATDAVNWPIGSPLGSQVSEDSRPMWSMLAANAEYLERYHTYFNSLLTDYFESGRFSEEIDALYDMIRPYVEKDPTAFVTVEEFDTAVETLKAFCLLRAESIRGQLDGTIPSTAEGQEADGSSLIDASEITISAMGSMRGGGGGQRGGGSPGGQTQVSADNVDMAAAQASGSTDSQPPSSADSAATAAIETESATS